MNEHKVKILTWIDGVLEMTEHFFESVAESVGFKDHYHEHEHNPYCIRVYNERGECIYSDCDEQDHEHHPHRHPHHPHHHHHHHHPYA